MTDRKYTPVESVELPGLRRPLYRPVGVAEPPQLPNRNHTMLSMSQSRQPMAPM